MALGPLTISSVHKINDRDLSDATPQTFWIVNTCFSPESPGCDFPVVVGQICCKFYNIVPCFTGIRCLDNLSNFRRSELSIFSRLSKSLSRYIIPMCRLNNNWSRGRTTRDSPFTTPVFSTRLLVFFFALLRRIDKVTIT